MTVLHDTLRIHTEALPTFSDVTDKAKEVISDSGVKNGVIVVFSQHTTCSIILQEDSYDTTEDGTKFVLQDLIDGLKRIFPKCTRPGQYLHPGPKCIKYCEEELDEPLEETLNTDAHLRSCVIGRSESIPIVDGSIELGQFGNIYFVDFDSTRPRDRIVHFQVIGE
jgi:thiamine phosphate synthase YjbQ (UPF0047 family)